MDLSLLFPALARRRSSPQLAAARRSSPQLAAAARRSSQQLAAARRSSPLPACQSRVLQRACTCAVWSAEARTVLRLGSWSVGVFDGWFVSQGPKVADSRLNRKAPWFLLKLIHR